MARNLVVGITWLAVSLGALACSSRSGVEEHTVRSSTPAATAPTVATAAAASSASAMKESACPTPVLTNIENKAGSTDERPASSARIRTEAGTVSRELQLKRFVVSSGVNHREPLASEGALPADGTPIFGFAELSNASDRETHVHVTFQRQGSNERVGNVALTIPAKATRYRTWAKTRFVRQPGTWIAVIANEQGAELGRATFVAGG